MAEKAKILRAGVIGAGNMGRNHIRVYSEMNNVKLAAIADPDLDSLNRSTSLYSINGYADYREMIDKEDLNFISLVAPTCLHFPIAKEVLRRGIHILVEKPLASSVEEGRELIAAAKKIGVILGVGHVERYNPVINELKKHLATGTLGNVFQITIRRIGPFPERIKDVGVLLDLSTHDIDILYYLTQAEILNARTESARYLHEKNEDLAVSTLRFANGVIGVLIENWLSPVKVREVAVNGERGMLVADLLNQDLYFYENNYSTGSWESLNIFRGMSEGNMTRFYIARGEPLRLELAAFVEAVQKQQDFTASGEDGLKALTLAVRLSESAQNQI
ncbi:MAG: Gfo/Idh/MocA family oxidoreductase [Syntrophomonadaceae bacterium]